MKAVKVKPCKSSVYFNKNEHIIQIEEGSGAVSYNGFSCIFQPGDYLYLPKGEVIHYSVEEEIVELKVISFSHLKKIISKRDYYIYLKTKKDLELSSIYYKNYLLDLIKKDLFLPKRKSDEPILEKIRECIKKDIRINWNIDKLCQKSKLSIRDVKLVLSNLNVTMSELVIKLKLENSVELLLSTESVVTTSKLLGFSSSSFFIKKFKIVYGMTPKNFIKLFKKS
ncbi:AraC family transcriptional regulator [Vibrio alginolyticus]|uniref:helix-turn-helix domain-containing protein n=3 Tax=Vibrio alginolyticus TaxID=663 RepID=UPI00215BC9AE|nr:AraC family transcriptional regulator [Vibrio alginolyticus]MCR9402216.1 AraC family transcriptional regulator [Vibrio alginolyticus]MCS0278501.1 AraC family transcriptional regulator [Vibrio alginolyticus]